MIIVFQIFLFSKEFPACNVCFGLFSKIKKGSSTNFWCTFSASFFHKNVPCLILYQWTKFQCHTLILSQDIKQNVLLKLVSAIFCQFFIFFIFYFFLILSEFKLMLSTLVNFYPPDIIRKPLANIRSEI